MWTLWPLDGAVAAGGAGGCLEAAYNCGNKGLEQRGAHRLHAFCEWIFSECGPAALQPTVIVTGHSFWFRTFFQVYLPRTAYHDCKHAKLVNCGVVMFELEQLQSPEGEGAEYRVAPESVVTLYGGFEEKQPRGRVAARKKA